MTPYPCPGYDISVIRILIGNRAKKQLRKVPVHVVAKLKLWVNVVKTDGLSEVRKLPGFHDEPLKGKRRGQRSIRLSKSYRAIYTRTAEGGLEIVVVEEVSKHEY